MRLSRRTGLYLRTHILGDASAFDRLYQAGGNANVSLQFEL